MRSDTWGSETSQYPEEKKTKVIPSVVANESGTAQTGGFTPGVVGLRYSDNRLGEASGKLLHRG
jgi:hypothetical protein